MNEEESRAKLEALKARMHPEQLAVLDRYLPKWPQMRLRGESVTPEQAKEIIRRTDTFWAWGSGNARNWIEYVKKTMEFPEYDPKKETWGEYWERRDAWVETMGVVSTHYVHNTWISSCYVGGPYGWCHPNGTLYYDKNIGKWPSGSEVLEDLIVIAEAFPFVSMAVTLMSGEHCERDIHPVMSFIVTGGQVDVRDPAVHDPTAGFLVETEEEQNERIKREVKASFFMPTEERERGVPKSWITDWAAELRAKMEGANT